MLAITLESINMVQGLRQIRLPSRHLTFKVKRSNKVIFQLLPKNDLLLMSLQIRTSKNAQPRPKAHLYHIVCCKFKGSV